MIVKVQHMTNSEPMLEITILNAEGEIVVHDTVPAQMATDAEISEMVDLIEGGCPAWLAAQIVIQSR